MTTLVTTDGRGSVVAEFTGGKGYSRSVDCTSATVVAVNVQLISGGNHEVLCWIFHNGRRVQTNRAKGQFAIVSCNYMTQFPVVVNPNTGKA